MREPKPIPISRQRRDALPPVLRDTARAFDGFLAVECGLANSTRDAYEADLVAMLADAADQGIEAIAGLTPPFVTGHVRALSKSGLSPSTIARHLSTIRVFSRWLLATDRIEDDPSALLEPPARWRKLPGVVSPGQMLRLLEAPRPPAKAKPGSLPLWERDKAILELMYSSGLRASEVCTLAISEIVDTLRSIRVTGKGNKQRLVPLGVPAHDAIDAYAKGCRRRLVESNVERGDPKRDAGKLFLSRTGRPLDRVRIWQVVTTYAKKAGIGHVHPHQLRHSFATDLLAGGADLRVVQELLGHASITTTQIYTHVDRSQLKRVHAQFHPRG